MATLQHPLAKTFKEMGLGTPSAANFRKFEELKTKTLASPNKREYLLGLLVKSMKAVKSLRRLQKK